MKIIIHTDADLTPPGKRTVRVVTLTNMGRPVRRIRLYVAGKIYHTMEATDENMMRAQDWLERR